MTLHNQRKASLGPHCGNCIYLDWDEDGSKCLNSEFIGDGEIEEEVAAMTDDEEASDLALLILDDHLADQDWQSYDKVCDLWRAKGHSAKEACESAFQESKAKLMVRLEKAIEDKRQDGECTISAADMAAEVETLSKKREIEHANAKNVS